MGFTTITTEEYAEGVRATAILGAVCDMLRDGTGYASDGICSILGIKREKEKCTLGSEQKKESE